MLSRDKEILRDLAKQIAEIAALPIQQETKDLWKKLNALKPIRPMVSIGALKLHVPWNEMNVDGELTLRTEDSFCRDIEERLRKILYSWRHLRVDMVVEPYLDFPKVINGADFGIKPAGQEAVLDKDNKITSHSYVDQLQTEDDIAKIRMPQVVYDEDATTRLKEKLLNIFDGILGIRMQGCVPGFSPWDDLAKFRGVEGLLIDLAERPEFSHKVISRLTDAYLSLLDQLEVQGLLGYDQGIVHVSVVYTDELPAPGYNPQQPRAKDLWTHGTAQIFTSVSPSMHQEFELDYAVKWYARFGLVYYGCCEPLHKKIHLVRKIPNLRKIAMSPWVDVEMGAQQIGRDFVFVRCPSATPFATSTWEPEAIEADIRDTISKCARYGCPLEFNVRNISTTLYQPQRLWEWSDRIMRIVKENAS